MALSWFLRRRKRSWSEDPAFPAEAIILRVESGLLMAFSPDGDPLTPDLVATICAADEGDTLRMETGHEVDRERALAVLDAQQRGPLAERQDSQWVKAMLGLSGGFEETPADLLAAEPAGPTPEVPHHIEDDRLVSEWLTPLTFDEAETSSMSGADAVLVRGLRDGMCLSSGRFEPLLDGWIVRPHELAALAVQRADSAADSVAIDVTAVSIDGGGDRWPIVSRRVHLA